MTTDNDIRTKGLRLNYMKKVKTDRLTAEKAFNSRKNIGGLIHHGATPFVQL